VVIILTLLAPLSASQAQNFSGGFTFYLPPQDTAANRFLPQYPATPITEFISVDPSGRFSAGGVRVRFFGTNAVADGAVPTKNKAWFIAGRLRKMGFNLVRFHHLDNPWSTESLLGSGTDTRHLNSQSLDRLENFVSELKKNGIYANLNLHVSRTFRLTDGVAGADSLVESGKGVSFFDPQLIALQKEYATQLLTHVNPYSGLPLAQDPVMAMIEITNENSLYRMWRQGRLKTFAAGGFLMVRHNSMLDSLWNQYLSSRYAGTADLATAWSPGTFPADTASMINNGGFERPIGSPWGLEQYAPGRGQLSRDASFPYKGASSAKVQVTQTDGENWRVQWRYVGLSMVRDSVYVVNFAVRADSIRTISVGLMLDSSPWTAYGWSDVTLTPTWKYSSFSFRAPVAVNSGLRLSFQLGSSKGSYWFDDVSYAMSGIHGVLPGESLEARTVRRIDFNECVQFSDQRVRDMTAFYMKLQSDFFAEMTSHLKGTLHVRVPIVGTNWNIGLPDLAVQSKLDYTDNHAYWDHPDFPGVMWSPTTWTIDNQPMVKSENGGSVASLFSGPPFLGKPSTISEYNHSFPNKYQSEAVPFLTAYASLQDVDGVMFFSYNHTDDWENDKVGGYLGGYFDLHRNAALMSLIPSCAYAFRNFLVSPARQTIVLHYSPDDLLLQPKTDGGDWHSPSTFPEKLALRYRVRSATFSSATRFDPSSLPSVPVNPYRSDTEEILWNTSGLLSVSTPRFVAATGFPENYAGARIGEMTIVRVSDHASMTWVSLTDQDLARSPASLLTLSTRLQNTGMVWDGITTVHDQWGSAPTQMAPVSAQMKLHIQADSIRVLPLRPDGSPLGRFILYAPADTNTFVVSVDQTHDSTVWYGIQAYGKGVLTANHEKTLETPTAFWLDQNYPNPFNPSTTIRYGLPIRLHATLTVFNTLGQEVAQLVNGEVESGYHECTLDGSALSSGVYFYRFSAGTYIETKKLLLLR